MSLASRKPVRIRQSGRAGNRGVTYIHIFFYHIVLSSYHMCKSIIYRECIYALLYSYIHIYSFLYSYLFILFMHPILYAFLS